jgi:hypothetical protein
MFTPTYKLYYGVRYAKRCHPSELWVKYFTSSKIVYNLILEYGRDAFCVIHTKQHDSIDDAREWEEYILTRIDATNNPAWLNKHNGGKKFCCTLCGEDNPQYGKRGILSPSYNRICTDTARKHYSIANSGSNNSMFGKRGADNPNYGRAHTEITKNKIRNKQLGKIRSIESRRKQGDTQRGENHYMYGKPRVENPLSKTYIVTFPDKHTEIIICMKEFCEIYGLNPSTMYQVAKGNRSHHKKYVARLHSDNLEHSRNYTNTVA